MMTKKDYERAANIIREGRYTKHSRPILIEAFTTFFAADNPAFAYERFKEACQPKAPVPAPKAAPPKAPVCICVPADYWIGNHRIPEHNPDCLLHGNGPPDCS